jgi:hypothetical protein
MLGPLLIMLMQGDAIHPKSAALVLEALLLLALARRSVAAWSLLVLWSAFYSVVALPLLGSLTNPPLLSVWAISCLVLLLTPSMCKHVGLRNDEVTGVGT